jgi:DNA-binding response OmpR family regulator
MSARILVIDDDQQIRMLLRKTLETSGYSVDEATDGKAGFALYTDDPQDLVITDLIMPEREGLETIRDLLHYNPEVKIIAISGGGSLPADNYLHMAECFGAQRLFRKPFRVEDILAAVKELLT